MSSAFVVALGGAFQSSLSVIVTIFYGVIAAKLDMTNPTTIKDISTLCAHFFLPALLFASIGDNISIEKLPIYLPVFIWSLICILFTICVAKIAARWWGLPSWTVAAATFNNTTSLPLLLTKSFASTGVISSIAGNDIHAAVERATSYYLVSSLVAKIATFTLGPYLFDKESMETPPSPPPTPPDSPITPVETTGLLPKYQQPNPRSRTRYTFLSLSPITWSAILALVIGLLPPLHHLFFSLPQEGGYLSTWLSGSLANIGELFAVLQM
jgi:predicted permease